MKRKLLIGAVVLAAVVKAGRWTPKGGGRS
jgi:predicted small secreted protein